jgi:CRISPR-associated endonuclease/helicase Cas3
VPAGLEERHNQATGRARAEGGIAGANLLEFAKGYGGQHAGWDSDVRTPTRLGEETRTLRLARVEGGRLLPWCAAEDRDLRRSWALSEVKVRSDKVDKEALPIDLKAAAAVARQSWTRYEDDILLLPLIEHGAEGFRGELLNGKGERRAIAYHRRSGLRFC